MKTKIFILIIILIGIALGIWIYMAKHALPQNTTLFESAECPHCQKVMSFIKTNKLHQKFQFAQKRLDHSTQNVKELVNVMRFCGFDTKTGIPIPVLWTGKITQKCLTGDKDIIHYFKQQLKTKPNKSK